jgi:putative flavoprotein involved in K+ transport
MPQTDVVILGAGPAGLAMSRCLARRRVEHVVLERGGVAESWRSARWDSLRLLTPNWLTRLPDAPPAGRDPDGFMTAAEVTHLLEAYARDGTAPVIAGTEVVSVTRDPAGYRIATSRDGWRARAVVIATGACARPFVPDLARRLPGSVLQLVPAAYRNPAALPRGGVLVVGASATGVQLAEEIQRSGRPVTLAAGRHTRMPRRHRGRDIFHWLDAAGALDQDWRAVPDLAAARRQPSMQLAAHGPLDLARLARLGVRLTGRLTDADGRRLHLADSLPADSAASDGRLARLIARLDLLATEAGAPTSGRDAARPLALPPAMPRTIDLAAEGIGTVVWATGHRRDYDWLRVPVLDAAGEIRHDGGVTPAPGLYVLGLRFLRRRSSSFLHGIGADAEVLAAAVATHLSRSLAA